MQSALNSVPKKVLSLIMSQAYKLNTGVLMPAIGYGTYRLRADVHRCIDTALAAGYRSIDTAAVYRNETEIGKSLKELLPKYGLTRNDLFITSKLGPKDQGPKCREAALQSLRNLDMGYLDLYLIHWPGVQGIQPNDPRNKEMRKESWLQMEDLYKEGKLKAIGVSNYNVKHMQELLDFATVKPAILQIECHPHLQQEELIKYCHDHDVLFQAYSSLGTMAEEKRLLKDETISKIASELNRSPAQVLLRWGVQKNLGVLPKSTNTDHINDNIKIFDFELSLTHMDDIGLLNSGNHYAWNPERIH